MIVVDDCINYICSIKLKYFYIPVLAMIIFSIITIMYYYIVSSYPSLEYTEFYANDFRITSKDVMTSYIDSIDIKYDKFLAQKMVEEERKNDFLHMLKRRIHITFDNYLDRILKNFDTSSIIPRQDEE